MVIVKCIINKSGVVGDINLNRMFITSFSLYLCQLKVLIVLINDPEIMSHFATFIRK